jgi:hypothetical protein
MLSYLWGGAKKPQESESPETALKEAIEQQKTWKQQVDGTLDF